MDTDLFGVSKVKDGERSTVDGEEGSHAEDVTVKVGCGFWITDTETDVIEFPAYCLKWLRGICSWNGRWHGRRKGGLRRGVNWGQDDPADAGGLQRRSYQNREQQDLSGIQNIERQVNSMQKLLAFPYSIL